MDYKEFIADRIGKRYPERKDAQKEVLEEADEWSSFFENAILERLSNPVRESTVDIAAITEALNAFQDWCNGPLEDLRQTLHIHDSKRSQELLNYLNFHHMSNLFIQHWFRLLAGVSWDAAEARRFNTETQDYLAIMSVDYQKKLSKQASPSTGMSGAITGLLSEYDTGIISLQTMKSHPELLLLPAPGRFEHGEIHAKNADFLVLDTELSEAIGMQVKTHVDNAGAQEYDDDYVFLVDANIDLDDVVSKKQPGRTAPRVFSRPGLIAAHHINTWPKHKDIASRPWIAQYLNNDERNLMSIKFYANALKLGTRDTSPVAAERIGKRTLYHLYKKPADIVASVG